MARGCGGWGGQGPRDRWGTHCSLRPASLGFQDNLREGRGVSGPCPLDSDLTTQRLEASPELTLSLCQHCPENLLGWRRWGLRFPFGTAAPPYPTLPGTSSPLSGAKLRNLLWLPDSLLTPGPSLQTRTSGPPVQGQVGVLMQKAAHPQPRTHCVWGAANIPCSAVHPAHHAGAPGMGSPCTS